MSIYSQLEQESKKDIEYLNRAMALLEMFKTHTKDESILKRVKELEEEVCAHKKNDHRFRFACVPFDIMEYPKAK